MTKGSMEALRSHLEGNFCVQLGISGVTFTADAVAKLIYPALSPNIFPKEGAGGVRDPQIP